MSQWLVDIREVSYKMGGAAIRRYTKIQGASTESGAGLEDDGGGTRSQALVTHSVRFLLRFGELLGCGLSLHDDELEECVPELLLGNAQEKEEEVCATCKGFPIIVRRFFRPIRCYIMIKSLVISVTSCPFPSNKLYEFERTPRGMLYIPSDSTCIIVPAVVTSYD